MPVYEIDWSEEAKQDVRELSPFVRGPVFAAVDLLTHQAEIETRNRKRLEGRFDEFPEASWELRILGDHRVIYRIVERRTVRILRVILKGRRTTAEALKRSPKR